LARTTGASGSGFWPTPCAHDDGKTPEAHLAMKARMKGGPRSTITSLAVMVKATERGMWPTPTSRDWKDGTADSCANVPVNSLLGRAVHWPTPKARDYRVEYHTSGVTARESPDLNKLIGGALNPAWVSALMGFPLDWTEVE
jgi:hypothetical protein